VVVVIFSSSPMMRAASRRSIIIGRRRRRRDTPRSRHCRSGYTPAVRRRSNPTRIPTRRRTSPTTNARDVSCATTCLGNCLLLCRHWFVVVHYFVASLYDICRGHLLSLSRLDGPCRKIKKINARRPRRTHTPRAVHSFGKPEGEDGLQCYLGLEDAAYDIERRMSIMIDAVDAAYDRSDDDPDVPVSQSVSPTLCCSTHTTSLNQDAHCF